MAYEKIVAVYDKTGKARDAAHALESAGFPSSEINLLHRDSVSDKDVRDGNLWQRVFGRNVSDQENIAYNRTIQSGGAVLTLRTADTDVNRAMRILDVHEPVDMSERVSGLRSATPTTATPATTATTTGATPPTNIASVAGREEVVRLAEEQLSVGKRQVETGKARIRRFVTEKPVESQITLHDEHCEVARRAVTDATPLRDIDWKDRTIEVTETSEQPVVSKTARVAEEIVIRRRGSDHVETIRDTVRRQQIEVEQVPESTRDVKKAA